MDTFHASQRRFQRQISLAVISQIIERGWHEKTKDMFKEEFGEWNYAIRGKSIGGRDIRVIVSFEADILVIVTAMEVEESSNENENRA